MVWPRWEGRPCYDGPVSVVGAPHRGDCRGVAGRIEFNRGTGIPIRYRERTSSTTNIQRWKHGWLLPRMAAFAARKLKFFG